MSYSIKINNVDKSSYVIGMSRIPMVNHNRTGEPVCEQITIKMVDQYAGVISEGDEVEIFWNGTPVWLGYVTKSETEEYNTYRNLFVQHYAYKLSNYSVRASELEEKIRDVGNWSGAKQFGYFNVNPANNRITILSHGFSSGDIVVLKSSGVLPGGLYTNYQYQVSVVDANTIELLYPPTGAPGSGIVDITSQGGLNDTHYITKNVDLEKFCEWDNAYLPNVSIEWLLKAMFKMIGCELTVEDPQFSFGARTLNARNMAIDLNMMKVLGYAYATKTPTSDDWETIITVYELFQRLVQIFKWQLVYNGGGGSKSYRLMRKASYSNYDFNDYVTIKYNKTNVFNTPSQVYGVELFAPIVGGTCRNAYKSATKTNLEEHNRVTSSINNYEYPYPSNLKILVRKTSPTYHISYDTSPIPTEEYIPISSMVGSYQDTYENDYIEYEYGFANLTYLDIINHRAFEVWMDLESRTFEVKQ
jgi:hypothetical protein